MNEGEWAGSAGIRNSHGNYEQLNRTARVPNSDEWTGREFAHRLRCPMLRRRCNTMPPIISARTETVPGSGVAIAPTSVTLREVIPSRLPTSLEKSKAHWGGSGRVGSNGTPVTRMSNVLPPVAASPPASDATAGLNRDGAVPNA